MHEDESSITNEIQTERKEDRKKKPEEAHKWNNIRYQCEISIMKTGRRNFIFGLAYKIEEGNRTLMQWLHFASLCFTLLHSSIIRFVIDI